MFNYIIIIQVPILVPVMLDYGASNSHKKLLSFGMAKSVQHTIVDTSGDNTL